jgi:hypothetical protein
MSENEIKVTVTKYADHKFYLMRYVDPVTGKRHTRSTATTANAAGSSCAFCG